MAYEELSAPDLDDFSQDQLRCMTAASATGGIILHFAKINPVSSVGCFDESLGEQRIDKYYGYTKVFEKQGRPNKVEVRAWFDHEYRVARLDKVCEGTFPEIYASLLVELLGTVCVAKARGMNYPHDTRYELLEIRDEYSELNGGMLITSQLRSIRDGEYRPVSDAGVLSPAEASDLSNLLVESYFEGDYA